MQDLPYRAIRPLYGRLLVNGIDAPSLLREVGLDVAKVLDPAARMPYERWIALWRRAELESGDPAIGLHVAEAVDLSVLAGVAYETEYVLVQLVTASETLGEGLRRFSRYYPLGFGPAQVELREHGGTLTVLHHFPREHEVPRALADLTIATMTRLIRDLPAKPVKPSAIRIPYPARDVAEYRRVLGGPLEFDAPDLAVEIDAAAARVKLRTAQPALAERLEIRASEQLAALTPPPTFADQVRAAVARRIEQRADESAAAVARAVKVSVRTLTRRLAEAGTSLRQIVDERRAALAERYLADPALTIRDVATRLGFADASSFHRAFRRWTGRSPAERR